MLNPIVQDKRQLIEQAVRWRMMCLKQKQTKKCVLVVVISLPFITVEDILHARQTKKIVKIPD